MYVTDKDSLDPNSKKTTSKKEKEESFAELRQKQHQYLTLRKNFEKYFGYKKEGFD